MKKERRRDSRVSPHAGGWGRSTERRGGWGQISIWLILARTSSRNDMTPST